MRIKGGAACLLITKDRCNRVERRACELAFSCNDLEQSCTTPLALFPESAKEKIKYEHSC
jgi:hypothetical protein